MTSEQTGILWLLSLLTMIFIAGGLIVERYREESIKRRIYGESRTFRTEKITALIIDRRTLERALFEIKANGSTMFNGKTWSSDTDKKTLDLMLKTKREELRQWLEMGRLFCDPPEYAAGDIVDVEPGQVLSLPPEYEIKLFTGENLGEVVYTRQANRARGFRHSLEVTVEEAREAINLLLSRGSK